MLAPDHNPASRGRRIVIRLKEEAILGYGEQENGTEDSVQEIAEYWGDVSIDEIYAQVET